MSNGIELHYLIIQNKILNPVFIFFNSRFSVNRVFVIDVIKPIKPAIIAPKIISFNVTLHMQDIKNLYE